MNRNDGISIAGDRPYLYDIERQKNILQRNPFLSQILEAFPECAAIVNSERRIVAANSALKTMLPKATGYEVEGTRLGDHMQCVNALSQADGCGSTEACATCGSLVAQLAALNGKTAEEECCLTLRVDDITSAIDFRVYTSPLMLEDERFSVVSLVDISSEKRRRILERIFFHDVNNTAGAIFGLATLLPFLDTDEERRDFTGRISKASRQLLDEIESQRDLLAAENNELKVKFQEVPIADLLDSVRILYEHHPVSEHRTIVLGDVTDGVVFTDRIQLTRCLGNLVKNALEAVGTGETVTLSCTHGAADEVTFRVRNPGFIPRDVELQIFHRSFTTKGIGRGLGTYSVRLLVERFLLGRTGLTTSEEDGTEFFITLPRADGFS